MANTRLQRRVMTPAAFRPVFPLATSELEEMEKGVRRMFGDVFGTDLLAQPVGWMPAVEISETNDNIVIIAELPGMNEKNVTLEFEDDTLTLRGEKTEEKKEGNGDRKFHLYERTYGAFRRSFTLPRVVSADKIAAEFKSGVLTITLPKTAQAKAKGRHIPIVTK
jgi:HSP20 family molecular chaperone IbpA